MESQSQNPKFRNNLENFHPKCYCIYRKHSKHNSVYNQATTKLAFHSNETSKDKLSIIKNWLSFIVIQMHAKLHKNMFIFTCSLH